MRSKSRTSRSSPRVPRTFASTNGSATRAESCGRGACDPRATYGAAINSQATIARRRGGRALAGVRYAPHSAIRSVRWWRARSLQRRTAALRH